MMNGTREKTLEAFQGGIENRIRTLPKTELHIHSEAVMGPETYDTLRRRYLGLIPPGLPVHYADLSRHGPLDDMIHRFLHLQDLLRKPDDYALLAGDLKRYAARNNIRYMEVFMSPSRTLHRGLLDFADIMDPLTENTGPDIAFIIDVSRSFGPVNAASNLDAALRYMARRHRTGIVGIGLGGRESGNPVTAYRETFRRAREAGLHIVAHAGEESGPESVRDAVLLLGAERIGHGTSAIQSRHVMELLKERGITLEICPTSNLFTGAFVRRYEDHPLRAFRDSGLSVTVNTDDPALFGVDLNEELIRVSSHLGFGLEEIAVLLRTAISASFMSAAKKESELAHLSHALSLMS